MKTSTLIVAGVGLYLLARYLNSRGLLATPQRSGFAAALSSDGKAVRQVDIPFMSGKFDEPPMT